MQKEQLLVAEYSALTSHFRTYQSNRLNIILLAIPSAGAIMLNVYDKEVFVQICGFLMLYTIVFFLIRIDRVFMTRLRNYTIRLSEIEEEFEIKGYSSQKLQNERSDFGEFTKDATTTAIRHMIHAINFFNALFATFILCKFLNHASSQTHNYLIKYEFMAVSLPMIISIFFFFVIRKKVSTKNLPKQRRLQHS